MVFTDNGTKDLKLEREIVRLRDAKKCEVYIVLTPKYEGYFNGKSLPAYGRMGSVGHAEEFLVFHHFVWSAGLLGE